MKPIPIVLTINIAFFAVFGLFCTFLLNRPEMIPMFTSIQGGMNLLGAGIFYLDRNKGITTAFLIGFAVVAAVTLVGYYIMIQYMDQIGVDETYTMLRQVVTFPRG